MYQIVCNEKGSRTLEVLDGHLETIEKHNLFTDLLDSNGIVNENVLEKLRLNVRSLLNNEHPDAGLLKLCQDILFHDNMKAFGLHQLILLFLDWEKEKLEALLQGTSLCKDRPELGRKLAELIYHDLARANGLG